MCSQPSSFSNRAIASRLGSARTRARRSVSRAQVFSCETGAARVRAPAAGSPGGAALRTGLRTGTAATEDGPAAMLSNNRWTCGRSLSQESSRCRRATSSGTGSERSRANRSSSRLQASAGSSGGGATCGSAAARARLATSPAAHWQSSARAFRPVRSLLPPRQCRRPDPAMPAARSRCFRTSAGPGHAACRRRVRAASERSRPAPGRSAAAPAAARRGRRRAPDRASVLRLRWRSSTACDFGAGGALAGSTFGGGALAMVGAGFSTRLGSAGAICGARPGRQAPARPPQARNRRGLDLFCRRQRHQRDDRAAERAVDERLLPARGLLEHLVPHPAERDPDVETGFRDVLEKRRGERAVRAVAIIGDRTRLGGIGDQACRR